MARRAQRPRSAKQVAEVEAALDDDPRDARQATRLLEHDPLLEPGAVAPEVGDDPRERQPELGVLVARAGRGCRHDCVLPLAPVAGSPGAHRGVRAMQETAVGLGKIALTVVLRDAVAVTVPRLWKQLAEAPGDEVGLRSSAGSGAGQHQPGDKLHVALGIGESENRSPGAAEDQPPVDTEVPPQSLQVGEEVLGRVGAEIGVRVARVGTAPTAAALIEENDPVGGGIEVAPQTGRAAGARSAVEDDGGLAGRVTAGLPIHLVAVPDVEHAVLVRFDLRVERGHSLQAAAS